MKTGINRHLWTLAKNPYLCPFWSPEPAPVGNDADLNPLLDMFIRAANDPEVQKDFRAWKKTQKNRKDHHSKHVARHLYLESDLDKGLGD